MKWENILKEKLSQLGGNYYGEIFKICMEEICDGKMHISETVRIRIIQIRVVNYKRIFSRELSI